MHCTNPDDKNTYVYTNKRLGFWRHYAIYINLTDNLVPVIVKNWNSWKFFRICLKFFNNSSLKNFIPQNQVIIAIDILEYVKLVTT